ncbi:hypothetical protein OPT61_g2412 [Boeremia exigua]|uniref:Uncharacterized protein n=1 Tax=Boeremia exigua TaxID=749465 RepID=A0ACC2ILU0_9PLEO|nr:hypothetical protein OPT61_g2412 [Boeremia exigua]
MFWRAIAEGNWQRPLDFTVHSTAQGELSVPFSRYVYQNDSTLSATSFQLFESLPVELQQRVFQLCDPATIFQLMHTSHHTRTEAKKLLFLDPEAWYHVDAHWLLRGGHPAHTKHDLEFLACVEQLNVDFGWMYEEIWMTEEVSREWSGTEEEAVAMAFGAMDERIQDFWHTVRYRLPKLKSIILSDDKDRSEAPDDIQLPPDVYRKVGQMCPSHIKIFAYLLQGDGFMQRRMKRKLWRLVNNKGAIDTSATQEWQLCADHPSLEIIPPYKAWRGPVGIHEDCYTRVWDIAYMRKAIRVHRIAAMERCHFHESHKPFHCPAEDCDVFFQQPEEYTSHVIETKHDLTAKLPRHIELAFAENDMRLDRLEEIAHEMERPFLEWWGEYGSEKRKAAEKEFIHQLEHDSLYAQDGPVMEHPQLLAIYRSIDGGGV